MRLTLRPDAAHEQKVIMVNLVAALLLKEKPAVAYMVAREVLVLHAITSTL